MKNKIKYYIIIDIKGNHLLISRIYFNKLKLKMIQINALYNND
ncbi:hypothetical protein CLOSBL3_12215 [Clostridiaceae bacterium BL-3]|nr:hypothetical protein CLOSBL3_12215 [Clostridiaceae bacterium BL-3]